MDDKLNRNLGQRNEGEGNKTADKQYRDAATEYAKKNDTVKAGLDAERDVEQYKDEYDRAEQKGRQPSAGDLKRELEDR